MNPFGNHFSKFARRGYFFQKGQLLRERRQRLRTSGRDICEIITNLGKSRLVGAPTEFWLFICTVGINSNSFPWPVQRAHGVYFRMRDHA